MPFACRRARARQCHHCHTWILTGLDADLAAGTAHTDTTPLTSLGELAAQLSGLTTYHLRRDGQHLVLDRRDQFSIAGKPANQITRGDILPEHDCQRAWTGPLARDTNMPAPTTTGHSDAKPPF